MYDYIFYLSKETKVNLKLIKSKLVESEAITEDSEFNIDILKELLNNKFKEINYTVAKEDVIAFIEDTDSLNLWNEDFFMDITKRLESV